MTDQTQSAVEAMARAKLVEVMARAAYDSSNDDFSNPEWENLREWHKEDLWLAPQRAALTALIAHLTASGWQIVPKVATAEMGQAWAEAVECITTVGMTYEEWNTAVVQRDWAAMLAAAPQFPGRDG